MVRCHISTSLPVSVTFFSSKSSVKFVPNVTGWVGKERHLRRRKRKKHQSLSNRKDHQCVMTELKLTDVSLCCLRGYIPLALLNIHKYLRNNEQVVMQHVPTARETFTQENNEQHRIL